MRTKYLVNVTKALGGGWKALLVDFGQVTTAEDIPGLHAAVRAKIAEYEGLDPEKVNIVIRFLL